MSLSDLASLGSFVSGLAVLASLVFLYFQVRQVSEQVRQAERSQRATNAQVRTSLTQDFILRSTDPAMAATLVKALAGAELTPTEVLQFMNFCRASHVNAEGTFLQHQQGLLDDAAYRAYLASISSTMANAAFRLAWRTNRPAVGPEFAAFIDQVIAETPMRGPISADERLAQWKAGWADLVAKPA
jgi:hypothetical protein